MKENPKSWRVDIVDPPPFDYRGIFIVESLSASDDRLTGTQLHGLLAKRCTDRGLKCEIETASNLETFKRAIPPSNACPALACNTGPVVCINCPSQPWQTL